MEPEMKAFLVILPAVVIGICGAISIVAILMSGRK